MSNVNCRSLPWLGSANGLKELEMPVINREFRGSYLADIRFGEFSYAIERRLQIAMGLLHCCFICVLRHEFLPRHSHERAGEWFWNDELIPGIEHPGTIHGNVKRRH